MEKVNICRTITLYNNFLPADKSKHQWNYCAFGAVDGIHVGERLTEKDIPLGIWSAQGILADELNGKYTAQQVYILKYDFIQKEESFWTLDNEFPFLFFMRIQCGENKQYVWKNIEQLEDVLCIENEIVASVYLTLDNADIFIILRSKFYEQGVGMIDSLYSINNLSFDENVQCALKSSFTIFAIKHSWIDDLSTEYFKNSPLIKDVFIKLIKKGNGNTESIRLELTKKKEKFVNKDKVVIDRNTILGIDDDLVSIKNISWYDFLSLYKSKDGIFCNWTPLYQENIAAATTIIKTDLKDYTPYLERKKLKKKPNSPKGEVLENIYKDQIDVLKTKLKKYSEQTNEIEGVKELKLIVNVLPKFAGEIFNDYIFFPVISPLNTLLDILWQYRGRKKDIDPFFKFIKGFSMYAQDSVRLDKHSMQALDFNTKIYDIPCKLNAFYYALIYNINKILNVPYEKSSGKNHKYEFLVVPGLTKVEDVRELYAQTSDNLRLMEIEMPERNYYRIQDMIIILTHELAHYVGGKYRNRQNRYNYLISSYMHIYISYVRNALLNKKIMMEEQMVERLEYRATKLMMEAMKRDVDINFVNERRMCNVSMEYCDEVLKKNCEYNEHFLLLLKMVDITMTDIVDYGLESIFSPILYELNESEKNAWEKIIMEASENFIYKSIASTTRLTSQTTLSVLKMLYEECFADLMAIAVLKLQIKDYLSTIIKSAKQQGMELDQLVDSEIMYRVSIVLICVLEYKINDYDVYKIQKEIGIDTEEYKVLYNAFKRWDSMDSSNRNKYDSEDYDEREFYVYKDEKVIENVCHYLMNCYGMYKDDYEVEVARKNDLERIYNIFSDNFKGSIEKKIVDMVEFIEKYRRDILYELRDNNERW